jgi:class 3 adenylate cyclase
MAIFSGLLMLGVILMLEQNFRESLIRESIEKGLGIARGVAFNAEDPLLTGDDLYLFSAITNATRSPGIRYAMIVDNELKIRAASDVNSVGGTYQLPAQTELIDSEKDYQVKRIGRDDDAIYDLQVPVFTLADTETPVRLGAIHLGLSDERVNIEIMAMRYRLAILTAIALIIGIVIAYALAGVSVQPVHYLLRGVRAVGAGNLDQNIEIYRKDEIGVLTQAFNDMTDNLREKEFIKRTFERYVSKQLVDRMLKRKDEIKLGGEEMTITILFSDIRRFTSIAERLPPKQVVELLNDYFTRMISVVTKHDGVVDKLMGDSVMALFGVPFQGNDDTMQAVRCAIAMQKEVKAFNKIRTGQGLPTLEMGIGLNTGPVIAGNIGSKERMEYTVIGDSVNVAARLQGLAKPGEVLVSEATYKQVKGKVLATPTEQMTLKGKRIPVGVYRIDSLLEI